MKITIFVSPYFADEGLAGTTGIASAGVGRVISIRKSTLFTIVTNGTPPEAT